MRTPFLTAIFILVSTVAAVASQQADQVVALKSEAGVLLVWNEPGNHFTVELRGDEIEPLPESGHVFFRVEGVVVQVGAIGVDEFAHGAGGRPIPEILAAHRDWEARYIGGRLGAQIVIQSSEVDLGPIGKGLLWGYDMPPGLDAEAKKQIYLTVLNKRHVLYFNGVVTAAAAEGRVTKLLMTVASSLRVSRDRVDVKKPRKKLRVSNPGAAD